MNIFKCLINHLLNKRKSVLEYYKTWEEYSLFSFNSQLEVKNNLLIREKHCY